LYELVRVILSKSGNATVRCSLHREGYLRLYRCLRHGSQSQQQRYFLSSFRGVPVPFAHSTRFNYFFHFSQGEMIFPKAQVLRTPSCSSIAIHWAASQSRKHYCCLLVQWWPCWHQDSSSQR